MRKNIQTLGMIGELIIFVKSVKKIVGGFKDDVGSAFNTSKPKQTMYGWGKKLSKPKIQKQFEENN